MLRTVPVTQGTLGQYSPTNEGPGHSTWVTGSAARERPMGLHRQTASVLQDDGRVGTSRLGTSEMRLASPLLGGWAECPASWVRGGLEPGSALLASVNKQTNKQQANKQISRQSGIPPSLCHPGLQRLSPPPAPQGLRGTGRAGTVVQDSGLPYSDPAPRGCRGPGAGATKDSYESRATAFCFLLEGP